MSQQLKSFIKKGLNAVGLEVRKKNSHLDLDVYRSLFATEEIEQRHFYNIGAGPFRHLAWTNVDYSTSWYKDNQVDINYNLFDLAPLPIAAETANIIYSSHTIEHINDEAAQNMFDEAYRVLKKNGFIRLTTPNIDLCYSTIENNDRYFWKQMSETYSLPQHMAEAHICKPMQDASLQQIFLFVFASQISELTDNENVNKISDQEFNRIFAEMPYEEALDYCISKCKLELQKKYPVDHINWWNRDKLFRMLRLAGFNEVYLSAYGQSLSPVLRNTEYFDYTCPYLSIYVEARK